MRRVRIYIIYVWYRWIGAIFRILPIKKGRIVFMNFFGKGYGDNPKYICEELIKHNNNNLELLWFVKKDTLGDFPDKVKVIPRGTLKELYYLSTANVWVDNSRKHLGVKKRKKQLYIQTWHGGIALKKIENDAKDILSHTYIVSAKDDSKMIDILLAGNLYFSKIYGKTFWYDGEIFNSGTPKTDIFFKNPEEYRKKVYSYWNIPENESLILYVPTFRDDGNISVYNIDYNKLLCFLERYWGGKWRVIVKLHPNIMQTENVVRYSEKIINGNTYSDTNHLIIASKLIVTDYSSCMFDAIYAKKRVILYASDQEKYFSSRGTYFKYSELPFPKVGNMNQLHDCIINYNEEKEIERCNQFLKKIGSVEDGNASYKVAKRIINYMHNSI